MRRFAIFLSASVIVLSALPVFAQNRPTKTGRVGCPNCVNDGSAVSQSLQRADELYASFKTKEAQGELFKVLVWDPQNAEAFSKLARVYIDFGDMIPQSSFDWQEKKLKEYRTAEAYARKAVNAEPNSTWGHFYVAVSLGSIAALSPVAKQIDLAGEIRSAVEKAIALDPKNGFAYHVYGIWHRKMAEIGKTSRLFASVVYGRSLPSGSFAKSIDYLKKAVALNPNVIASRLELARSFVAVENWSSARALLGSIRELPVQFSDDPKHKEEAEQLLEEIKEH
jgi:tetratricopeptide (TPR) repeat protein